jgi:hypothetical protein
MGDFDMRPAEEIERFVKHISFRASRAMDEDLWADIARAGDGRTEELAPDRRDIRRFIMRMSTKRIAIVALVCIGAGAITAVAVNIGRVYYRGMSDDGTHHIFYSEGPSGDGFTVMDANGVTAEQAQADLEEMQNLSQQGKRELLKVKETIIGAYRLKTHEYRYQLPDGRTGEMGEPADDMPVYSQEQWEEFSPQLKEFFQLRDAGPGEDLGTHEETVKGRVFSFKRERYVLSDGTEVIWSVGTPKEGQ